MPEVTQNVSLPMTQNVPLQTWQAESNSEVTQQGEILAVTSPSPLGCELPTDPEPVLRSTVWHQAVGIGKGRLKTALGK